MSGSSKSQGLTMRRWAVELTGRNSVSPSMMPRRTERRYGWSERFTSGVYIGSWQATSKETGFFDRLGRPRLRELEYDCVMTLTLELPPGVEDRLRRRAEAEGKDV